MAPTSSPVFVSLSDHEGCPPEYNSGDDYEANDKVSVFIKEDTCVVYQCSSDVHQSRYCSLYEPGNEPDLGWILIAYGQGTLSPTTSPNFSSLREVGDGCPPVYSVQITYEAGDEVSVFLDSDQAVVYECKEWPNGKVACTYSVFFLII